MDADLVATFNETVQPGSGNITLKRAADHNVVETFDVDMLQGMSVGLFPLENTSVQDVSEALQAMLGGTAGGTAGRRLAFRGLGGASGCACRRTAAASSMNRSTSRWS